MKLMWVNARLPSHGSKSDWNDFAPAQVHAQAGLITLTHDALQADSDSSKTMFGQSFNH